MGGAKCCGRGLALWAGLVGLERSEVKEVILADLLPSVFLLLTFVLFCFVCFSKTLK